MNGAAALSGLARNPSLPAEVLDAMVRHSSPRVRGALAEHPQVSPAARATLLADNHFRVRLKALGREGQAPLAGEAVVRLLSELAEPSLDWRMTEDEALSEFFERNGYDPRLLRIAAEHGKPRVRRFAAGFVHRLDEPIRQALLNDPEPEVRQAAQDWLAWQTQVMRPADLPVERSHTYFMVLNRTLSRELVDQVVASGHTAAIRTVAGNPTTPPDVVENLTGHWSAEIRARAIVHPSRGGDAYQWVRSDNPFVRRHAAEDPRLPAELVAILADDPESGVRLTLALHHPQAPAELLLRSYVEHPDDRLTERPRFPQPGLARYAGHAEPALRKLAALDPDADPETVERLLADPDPLVRQAMAQCPRLPVPRIAALLDDPDLTEYAAANPALPVDQMHRILDSVVED